MRTITKNVYTFSELSDKAKERAISDYRVNTPYLSWDDALESLNAFMKHFKIGGLSYSVGTCSHSHVITGAKHEDFRGVKLKDFTGDEMPTGYCADYPLWHTFHEQFKKSGDAHNAFKGAIAAWLADVLADMEDDNSDERISENIEDNDYEFYDNGEMI